MRIPHYPLSLSSPPFLLSSLQDILGLVVSDKNELEVVVEFASWRATQYFVTEREAFVGSLAEVMVASAASPASSTSSSSSSAAAPAKAQHFSIRLEPLAPHTLPEKPLPLYQVKPGGGNEGASEKGKQWVGQGEKTKGLSGIL